MNHWHIARPTAEKITTLILDHYVTKKDIVRYCRNFVEHHNEDERIKLFSILVVIIKSDGAVLPRENEVLRFIAEHLKIDPAFVNDNIPKETQ